MKIVVLRETQEGEARVALMPESIRKLVGVGSAVHIESRAGLSAARTDDDYREAGAEISSDREALLSEADVLAAAGEQVKSLGATFLEVDLGGIKTEDAGGYAVELSEEAMNRGRALIAEHAKTADVIITTAQVPGRRAPLLITKEAVEGMKRGSIVIDLAGATGGNCALSQPDVVIEREGVTITAPTNL